MSGTTAIGSETNPFDFIVVGAGSSGAVIASKFSENGRFRVLVLEAGGKIHWLSRVPVSYAFFMKRPDVNWLYESEAEESTANRKLLVPRGRMLGGSSAINGSAWVRGNARDYDQWADMGNEGWSYKEILPLYKAIERYDLGDPAYRGKNGPIGISEVRDSGGLYDSFVTAAATVGITPNVDYNGAVQDGIAMTQASIRGGRRSETFRAYLKGALPNLTIRTDCTAQRLILREGRCVGVRCAIGDQVEDIYAAREVILSAGVVGSAQLLELSGIGAAERLRSLGIEVTCDLPGVGENLRDHWAPRMQWRVAGRGVTYNERARGIRAILEGLKYFTSGGGFLGMPAGPQRAFFRTRPDMDIPDAMFALQPFIATPKMSFAKEPGFTVGVHQLRPASTGSIHITDRNPERRPAIRFNFMSEQEDRDCLLAAMRVVRRLVESEPMKWLEPRELNPGKDVSSDDDLLDFVRRTADTTFHPVGTCKMGTDSMAVVDPQLRLRGVRGLRVADASIMPTMPSGNTNAPSIMIGEKAARMILASYN